MTDTRADAHLVCCDANLALCGATLTGGAHYAEEPGTLTCPLCLFVDEQQQPCGAPGCDIGRDVFDAELEFALLGQCRSCGCTDDNACPGGCRWVPDPQQAGQLCSACAPASAPAGG